MLDPVYLKHTACTHRVPLEAIADMVPLAAVPCIGDLVVAEVLRLGKHSTYEDRAGVTMNLFPGDLVVGAFGNRYATDQFEGYVPEAPIADCDMLSIGGVLGTVASRHESMPAPTRLRVLGAVCGPAGRPLSLRAFGLGATDESGPGQVILVIGSSMNAGKTTLAGTIVRALRNAGRRVGAAKVTGTAAGRDIRYVASCGARPALDFTDAGFPATYMLSLDELLGITRTLVGHLRATRPDYVVLEVADGVFQRETRMLLESPAFRAGIDHVFFAAADSLAAESGARVARQLGLPLRALGGLVTRSPLATREAAAASGLPCLSIERLLDGAALDLVRGAQSPAGATARPCFGVVREQEALQPAAA